MKLIRSRDLPRSPVQAHLLLALSVLLALTVGCSGPDGETASVDSTSARTLERAIVALQSGDYGSAISLVNLVDSRQPDLTESSYLRGQIYFDLQMYSEARSHWERVQRAEPDYWLWSNNLGDVAFRQQRFRDAAEHYQRAAELDPNPLSLHGLASAYLEMGMIDSTKALLRRAIQVDTSYAPAYLSLSTLSDEEGDLEHALVLARHALRLDSTSAPAASATGILLVRLGKHEEALPHLALALERDAYDHGALYNYGLALQRLGRAPEAQPWLDAAENLRVQERSLQLLRDAVANNPSNPANQLALAEALHQSGRLSEALRAYKAVDLLVPGNRTLRHTIATLHMESGDLEIAAARYRRILAEDSTFVEAWLNLGLAYARMDSLDSATQIWGRAAERFPEDRRVQQVAARLER